MQLPFILIFICKNKATFWRNVCTSVVIVNTSHYAFRKRRIVSCNLSFGFVTRCPVRSILHIIFICA
jgi:hypothetical protein